MCLSCKNLTRATQLSIKPIATSLFCNFFFYNSQFWVKSWAVSWNVVNIMEVVGCVPVPCWGGWFSSLCLWPPLSVWPTGRWVWQRHPSCDNTWPWWWLHWLLGCAAALLVPCSWSPHTFLCKAGRTVWSGHLSSGFPAGASRGQRKTWQTINFSHLDFRAKVTLAEQARLGLKCA